MVNMNVEWAGPNLSLATLVPELNGRFGAPTRPYEFETGYKSPSNVSGHNADANGRGHSLDIFVGGNNNISVEQGIDLAERLRLEGKKGSIPGHPDRLAYIIHRGRIAGDHTNWEWVKYNGIADHYDHIHISSVFDYYWGDPVAGNPLDYNSTAAWNLWGATSGQGSDITPIPQEDELSAAEVHEIKTFVQQVIADERSTIVKEVRAGDAALGDRVGEESTGVKMFLHKVSNGNGDRVIIDTRAHIAGLAEAISQISGGAAIDYVQIEAAAKRGAEAAIAEGVDVNVTVGGSK